MLPVTKLSLKPAILSRNKRDLRNFNQHVPGKHTEQERDAIAA